MGVAKRIWVTTSGGVRMAPKMKKKTTAYLRFFRKKAGVTRPMMASRVRKIGSSKARPKAMRSLEAKERYSRMVGRALIDSEAKPKKNLKPKGKTRK